MTKHHVFEPIPHWYDYGNKTKLCNPPVGSKCLYLYDISGYVYRECTILAYNGDAVAFSIESEPHRIFVNDLEGMDLTPTDFNERFEQIQSDKVIQYAARKLGTLCPQPEVLNELYRLGCLKIPDDIGDSSDE